MKSVQQVGWWLFVSGATIIVCLAALCFLITGLAVHGYL